MKRLHIHETVKDLPASIAFYSAFFGQEPSVTKSDYAKWMVEDPRINFAISTWGAEPGIDHLGIQTDSEWERAELAGRLAKAEIAIATEHGTTCCYANSNKHWTTDPSGMAWETYYTMSQSETRGRSNGARRAADAASHAAVAPAAPEAAAAACCTPVQKKAAIEAKQGCCG